MGVLKFNQLREVFLQPTEDLAYITFFKVGPTIDSLPSGVR